MSKIDEVQNNIRQYFSHISGPNYVRILDTPRTWGEPFDQTIMPRARARQGDFERAIDEVIQRSRYRCDLASLNSPDPDWARVVLRAMDTALSRRVGRTRPTQFRFLFGQTPLYITGVPPAYTAFKAALLRLVRARRAHWEQVPEIWLGRFYEFGRGIQASLRSKVFTPDIVSDDEARMTWNHAKIIAADGCEALVGGHNLNMDLFRSYPPVHDVSVIVHGDAARGSQLFLNEMWTDKELLIRDHLNVDAMTWKDNHRVPLVDPLTEANVEAYMRERQQELIELHRSGHQGADDDAPPAEPVQAQDDAGLRDLDDDDRRTLIELALPVFPERVFYKQYDGFDEYKLSTRMLAVGKYWTSLGREIDYKKASEIMKQTLISGAKSTIWMSQMDLISAWKKKWSDHVVCQWLIEALKTNRALRVHVVVSPQDGGAGAEGDQYSFGSGAQRTADLIRYYMTHDAATDALLSDPNGELAEALTRLRVAPFYYTDLVPAKQRREGLTYAWPDLPSEGYTATLKRPPLADVPPKQGIIGSAVSAVLNASAYYFDKVASAPGNHAKIMIVDDEAYVVGSDNLYPGTLSEFNYLVEGKEAVDDMLATYWDKLWQYSGPHAVEGPVVRSGTVSAPPQRNRSGPPRRNRR